MPVNEYQNRCAPKQNASQNKHLDFGWSGLLPDLLPITRENSSFWLIIDHGTAGSSFAKYERSPSSITSNTSVGSDPAGTFAWIRSSTGRMIDCASGVTLPGPVFATLTKMSRGNRP